MREFTTCALHGLQAWDVAEPLLVAGLERSPAALAAARALLAVLEPLACGAARLRAATSGMYALVHDELVPVALDWSARAPLLHALLSRLLLARDHAA